MPADRSFFAQMLGPDGSAPGFHRRGERTLAYVTFRGVLICSSGADERHALAALRAKIERHRERLQTLQEAHQVREVNLLADHGEPGSAPTRRFVRTLSLERARFELELGADGALVFVDEATGNFAVVSCGEGGEPQLLRLGDPVLGDSGPRPLPVPERTPEPAHEAALRARKAEHIRPFLRCPACLGELADRDGGLHCAACDRLHPRFAGRPVLALDPAHDPTPRGAISANPYGQQCLALIEKHRDGLVLDCGSGSPSLGFYNVVHLELFGYPQVDVITDGARLPFADATFAAVLSEAVLEHVRDPEAYLRETVRVLQPGGTLRVDAAFLQPYHGYPDHYFNMTRSGLALLLERVGLEILTLDPGEHQMPFVTLGLVLNGYVAGTADAAKRQRLLDLTIGEAIGKIDRGGDPFNGLTRAAIDKLAAGFAALARKPTM
jgi:SAM-dependent methyltransferase